MDNELKNIAVILPSLDPNEKFTRTLQSFLDIGFSDIIVVNDGSNEENLHYFEEAMAIERLIKGFGLSQEEVARKLGKSQSALSNKLIHIKLS